jgi:hypothetical protein
LWDKGTGISQSLCSKAGVSRMLHAGFELLFVRDLLQMF